MISLIVHIVSEYGTRKMASVNQLKPETMKVAELKYWLSQHKLSQKGKKADLIERYADLNEYHCKVNCL